MISAKAIGIENYLQSSVSHALECDLFKHSSHLEASPVFLVGSHIHQKPSRLMLQETGQTAAKCKDAFIELGRRIKKLMAMTSGGRHSIHQSMRKQVHFTLHKKPVQYLKRETHRRK